MLVVVGYSGGEEGVMELLKEAAKQFKDLVIYWTMYMKENFDLLSERQRSC